MRGAGCAGRRRRGRCGSSRSSRWSSWRGRCGGCCRRGGGGRGGCGRGGGGGGGRVSGGVRGRVLIGRGALGDEGPVRKALHQACVDPVSAPAPLVRRAGGAVLGAIGRLVRGPVWGIAVVPARGYPEDWLCARAIISVAPEGFALRRGSRAERVGGDAAGAGRGAWVGGGAGGGGGAGAAGGGVGVGGLWLGAGLAAARLAVPVGEMGGAGPAGAPRHECPEDSSPVACGARPTVSVVILSYNRLAALERTIGELMKDPALKGAQVIVADNASSDGTPEKIRRKFREVRVIDMAGNRGVAGFNAGVARATGEAVLILDDDAWPAEGVMDRALELLASRPEIGAVALHPRHPATQASEWGFVDGDGATPPASGIRHSASTWPFMGSGNLVRRAAWERVGGYEEAFFLYRNDVDL